MSNWEVGWEDDEPFIPIDMGGIACAATRDTIQAYTFAPQFAEVDHAYLTRQEKKRKVGYYMFRLAVPDFDQLISLMDDNYFVHIKAYKPSQDDIKAYAKFSAQGEERPEWLD